MYQLEGNAPEKAQNRIKVSKHGQHYLWNLILALNTFGRELRREILSLFAVWRMAGKGMKINEMLNLTLLFI